MAEVAALGGEEPLRRCAVQVDAIRVRQIEFHEAERIAPPRLLPQPQLAALQPRDRLDWRHRPAQCVEGLEPQAGHCCRISLELACELVTLDGGGHVPRRPECHAGESADEDRRRVLERRSHHDPHREDAGRAIGTQHVLGDVHDDRWRWELVRQPAKPFECKLQLDHAPRDWDVQRLQRARADATIRDEAVPLLEPAHRIDQRTVIPVLCGVRGAEIAQ